MTFRYFQTFANGMTLLSPSETYCIEINFEFGLYGLLYAISVLVFWHLAILSRIN